MTTIFVSALAIALIVSGMCSLMEAALYAVPQGFVKFQEENGGRSGQLLGKIKEDIGRPIAAILICNTVANTIGASVAGWAAGELFGSQYLAIFSVIFTLSILYFSEIIPKLVGVVYCKEVALLIALPLQGLIVVCYPLIVLSEFLSRRIRRNNSEPSLSSDEILSMTEIGTEEGALDHLEGSVIANVIGLDETLVRDVLTPRVVVFRKAADTVLSEVADELADWNHSRVPLYDENDPDHLSAYVIQRDMYRELLKGNTSIQLKSIGRPLTTVPELMRVDKLLLQMFELREHICAVVDEHGSLAGIITLEDIIEEIVGREIVDEYDAVSDLRTFAKLLRLTRHRRKS